MTDLISLVQNEIANEIRRQADLVSQGRCEDFAEYKRRCGLIQGLESAEAIITQVLAKQEEDDDSH